MSSSNDIEIKKATFSTDKTLVDQNDLEIPPNSIIHCLGSLFQITDQGLKHVVGKKKIVKLILQIQVYTSN